MKSHEFIAFIKDSELRFSLIQEAKGSGNFPSVFKGLNFDDCFIFEHDSHYKLAGTIPFYMLEEEFDAYLSRIKMNLFIQDNKDHISLTPIDIDSWTLKFKDLPITTITLDEAQYLYRYSKIGVVPNLSPKWENYLKQ